MRLLSVDDYAQCANNQPVNYADIGKRVLVRRTELGMTQEAVAERAEVGLGTVQALEDAKNRKRPRQTSPVNLEKIAKALRWSLDDLLKDQNVVEQTDPLVANLRREDYVIAQSFHRAAVFTKLLVMSVLHEHGENDAMIDLLRRVARLPEAAMQQVKNIVDLAETGGGMQRISTSTETTPSNSTVKGRTK